MAADDVLRVGETRGRACMSEPVPVTEREDAYLTISDEPTPEWPAEILLRALATFGRHLVGCASARGSERDCNCGYLSFFTAAERDALRVPT